VRPTPPIGVFPCSKATASTPALAGSHAVALTIFARLTGVSPIGLTAKAGGSSVPASQVPELETAAADALQRFPTP
jgi:hypothetical protein